MKVVTFERNGVRSYGILENDRVLDVGSRLASRYADLRAVLAAGALQELQSAGTQGAQTFRVEEVNFGPVIPNPEKILCVGLNYISHRTETKRPETKYPSIFTRFADTQVGHETPVLRPSFSTAFDYEGELAVMIGRRGTSHQRTKCGRAYCRILLLQRRKRARLATSHRAVDAR